MDNRQDRIPSREAPYCLSPRLTGSKEWTLVQPITGEMTPIGSPRSDCWRVDEETGVSNGSLNSANDLLRLNGYSADLLPPQRWRCVAESVHYVLESTRHVRWDLLMPTVEHNGWLKRLVSEVRRYISLCDLEYFKGVWTVGNRFLASLSAIHIAHTKVDQLLQKGLPPHHFKGFITFDGECEPLQYDRFGTRTGRLGIVSGPTVHSLPKKLRGLLRPSQPGYRLGVADVSALEPQLLSYLGGGLLPQVDIYDDIGRLVSESAGVTYPRSSIKEAVICEMYGSGIPRLAEALEIEKSAAAHIMRHVSQYMGADRLKRRLIKECAASDSRGLSIKNFYGRRCPIEEPLPHILLNTYAQSTGADVSLLLFQEFVSKWGVTPLFTIYDAVYFEYPQDLELPEVEELYATGFSQPFRLKIAELPRI